MSTQSGIFQIKYIDRDAMLYLVRSLDDFEKDKSIRSGLSSAGAVFKTGGIRRLRKSMKSGPTGFTGNLLKGFQLRVKRNKPGVLIGFNKKGSHAHLIDRGTDKRYQLTKGGKYVGSVKASRFWTQTEAEDHPKAMDKLYQGIERAVNRINNRR